MSYVLDASVGIKWVMNEVDSAEARHLRDDFRNQTHELIAPNSFPLEAAHALTKAARRGIVTDAARLWVELVVDSPRLFPVREVVAFWSRLHREFFPSGRQEAPG